MKLVVTILADLVTLLVAFSLTYFTYVGILAISPSWTVLKANWHILLVMMGYFLVLLNLFGLYNVKKIVYNFRRVLLATSFYFSSLLISSFLFPKYQFSKMLLFVNLTFIFFMISISRALLHKFWNK